MAIKRCGTCKYYVWDTCLGYGIRTDNQNYTYMSKVSEMSKMFPNGCEYWEISDYEEKKELNKKQFGFETFEGILCNTQIKGHKIRIAELEEQCNNAIRKGRLPSTYVLEKLERERKELAEWEERAKSAY